MPQGLIALLPTIAAIAGIAGTGVSLGETLANQPSRPSPPLHTETAPSATATTTTPTIAAQIAAQQSPNVQAQTGGSLAPASFSDMAANLSGNPGDTQGVQQLIFGSGNQGLTDMIAQLSQPPAQSLTTPQGG